MVQGHKSVLFVALFCLVLCAGFSEKSFAKDPKLKPEELVAKHLESIGSPEALAAIQSRSILGVCAVQRPIGTVPETLPEPGKRTDPANFSFASTGDKLGMTMKFYDRIYPGEHFAFDGKDSGVQVTSTNNRSLLGNFLNSYSGIMREGLLGGTLSTAWPLLRVKEAQCKLSYKLANADGVKLHQLEYTPRSRKNLNSIVIKLYFDMETFRHVMTEYMLMSGTEVPALIVMERFGSFKTVDGVTLPHRYSIEYCVWRDTNVTRWIAEAGQIKHGEAIDPQHFHVQ
ncbi:MAG: hypothetical protein QUT30_04445 [Acidobacteriota bacterium]|nr:hypothetical protein [Acidobacteriota bacterium]